MVPRKRIPTFNLSAVVQETGVKPDTLRAWERRYGLPQPERTSGGHRIYSQRDIETLKWLVARQEEGMTISRAVDLWRQYIEDGEDPFQAHPLPGAEMAAYQPAPHEAETLEGLRQAWIEATRAYQEMPAEQILTQAFALFPMETVVIELLQKGMAEIGEQWYQGKTSVQQEHFASMLVLRRMESLLASMPPPSKPGKILVFCPAGEEHIFPPLLITLLLRRRGYDVIFLGTNVPVEQIEQTIEATQPRLAIASAQILTTAASLLETAQRLHELRVPLGYGGLVFNLNPTARERIPGTYLGDDIRHAIETIEQMHRQRRPDFPTPRPLQQAQVVDEFLSKRTRIEAQINEQSSEIPISKSLIQEASYNLGRAIEAALLLGDVNLVGNNLSWLQGLLSNRQVPAEQLQVFLCAYTAAARETLESPGEPIVAWLQDVDLTVEPEEDQ